MTYEPGKSISSQLAEKYPEFKGDIQEVKDLCWWEGCTHKEWFEECCKMIENAL